MARTSHSVNALTRTRITFHTSMFAEPRLNVLFDTLLHEMIHVYFAHFVCKDDVCVCWQALRKNIGNEGHGRAFLWVATAMEEVSERLLGWRARIRHWRIIDGRSRGEKSITRSMIWMFAGRVLSVRDLGIDEYVEDHLRVCWLSEPVSPDV